MVSVCFYFQVHQPFRLRRYSVFEIGHHNNYFDNAKNEAIIRKVAKKCYIPANNTILELINKTNGKFKAAYSLSGTVLEQLETHEPKVRQNPGPPNGQNGLHPYGPVTGPIPQRLIRRHRIKF